MADNSRQITVPFAACEDKPYIFASYAHNDKDKVFPLLKELYEAGYNVWYDQGITIGTDCDRTIKDHITRSEVFLFFTSNQSLSREYILDDELPPARESHSDDKMIALYLEDVKKIPDRAVDNMPVNRYSSLAQVVEHIHSLGVKNFGKRTAVPIERDVPPYWHDDYDLDPTGGTNNCVHTAEKPYVCLAFDPRDITVCNPYAKELLFAGYNVRSCENEDDKTRAKMFADPDCAAYVPFLTKKYVESGQLERDYTASKKAGKPFIALYMQTFDSEGKEEEYEVPASIAKEFTAIQGLSIRERTVNDFLSELEADLEKRGCYASMKDGKVERRAFEIPDFLYDFTDEAENKRKGIVLTKYTGDGEAVIRRSYGGYPVREIGKEAFVVHLDQPNESLVSVNIPEGVTTIGNHAFYKCHKLVSVTIPDSVTSIGNCALGECHNLTSVKIPDNVTCINDGVFGGCYSLTSITIPDKVTSIGIAAFVSCCSLASVTIPHGVTGISECAFDGCYSLASVTIPKNVTSIGDSAFSSCTSLASVTIPDSVTSIGRCAFSSCKSLTSVTIPDSVTSIGKFAFNLCISLASVKIPDGITSISECAFAGCYSLASVTIPKNVTSIGDSAFSSCNSLASITIPDSVTSIGEYAFSWCSNLASLAIRGSNTSIGKEAFKECEKLTVFCHEGSKALKYCEENNIPHKPLESAPEPPKEIPSTQNSPAQPSHPAKKSRPGLVILLLILAALVIAAGVQFTGLFDILGWLGDLLGL